MSGKQMGLVWERDVGGMKQLVLLALADHADHEGMNVKPSVGLVAWKVGKSKRQVQRVMASLREAGALVVERPGGGRMTALYRLNLDALPPKPPRTHDTRDTGPGPETMTSRRHVTHDISSSNGDTQMSPEPSLEPSLEPNTGNGFRRSERTVIKNALVEAARWEPENITKRQWGRVEEAAKDLHSLPAPPSAEDILAFALFWERRWEERPSPQAVSGNWADYKAGKLFIDRPRRR